MIEGNGCNLQFSLNLSQQVNDQIKKGRVLFLFSRKKAGNLPFILLKSASLESIS